MDRFQSLSGAEKDEVINEVAQRNVLRTVDEIIARSELIRRAVAEGQVMVVGALYDVRSGAIDFYTASEDSLVGRSIPDSTKGDVGAESDG